MKLARTRRYTTTVLLIFACEVALFRCVAADESDDRYWHGLTPSALGLSGFVNCLTVFKGELIAAGGFATAGKDSLNSIARWDGTKWKALGSGTNRPIWCLAVYKGELIAGGEFTNAGGVAANGIARWNGSQWKPLSFGVRGATKDEWVHVAAMVEYDGKLIVGGRFSYAGSERIQSMASWNGSDWSEVPYDLFGDVRALTVFRQQLIAAGDVSEPSAGTLLMRFDGVDRWSVIGSGDPEDEVDAVIVYKDNLIVGGKFAKIEGVEATGIASWDGTSWQPLGAGLGQNTWCLSMFNGELIAAGASGAIASWDGTKWENLGTGTNGDINSCLEFDGKLIVSGSFNSAGPVRASNVVVWNKPSSLANHNAR